MHARLRAAFLTICLVAPMVSAASGADSEQVRFVDERYGQRIEFDVLRDGKSVGEHVTTFAATANRLEVHSCMELSVTVLFIPVYRCEYESTSVWCREILVRLSARTKDGGKATLTQVEPAADGLIVRHGEREQPVAENLMPTDHWNPRVLQRSQVLNTITGRLNMVQISRCNSQSTLVATAAPRERCYEYSGELAAKVWYDGSMRWVGLEFAGLDGSEIVYLCRDCQASGV
jgi:hypothetical protein